MEITNLKKYVFLFFIIIFNSCADQKGEKEVSKIFIKNSELHFKSNENLKEVFGIKFVNEFATREILENDTSMRNLRDRLFFVYSAYLKIDAYLDFGIKDIINKEKDSLMYSPKIDEKINDFVNALGYSNKEKKEKSDFFKYEFKNLSILDSEKKIERINYLRILLFSESLLQYERIKESSMLRIYH
jgi:hypothetical protein